MVVGPADWSKKLRCFVIMPFTDSLHYFYLYIKQYIETNHQILCERADDRVLTVPLLNKITEMILAADFVIADCTGRNANVFYELGLAHAYEKPVILITGDPVSDAPSDVRHFEFIPYKLGSHIEFLRSLDNAIENLVSARYRPLYEVARSLLESFVSSVGTRPRTASFEMFYRRVKNTERRRDLPAQEQAAAFAEFVLAHLVEENTDFALLESIRTWSAER